MPKILNTISLAFGIGGFILALRIGMNADINVINKEFFSFIAMCLVTSMSFLSLKKYV